MSTEGIFHLRGNTRRFTAQAGLSAGAVQVSNATGFPPASDYTITNLGPEVAFVGWGPDVDTAIANAKEPKTGDSQFCVVVCPGQMAIEARSNAYFAASTVSGTAELLISPGHGLVSGFGSGKVSTDSSILMAMLDFERGEHRELQNELLIELRTITHFLKEGLNVAEDPDSTRSDEAAQLN